MRAVTIVATAAALAVLSAPATAQSFAELIALGDSAHTRLRPEEALEHYRAALALQPTSYEAMWKLARSQIDVAKQILDDSREAHRDSLYGVAVAVAASAVQLDSTDAEGHFVLATAIGRHSRTKGGKERVQFGGEIYDEGANALALNPDHDGAHHVIGAWHAEIKRLSGVARFFARTFMGGGYMGKASWDSAVVHLERAVEIKPDYVYHHLELAEILIDLDRYSEARQQLQTVLDLPVSEVLDPVHKETAARLIEEIRGRTDPGGSGS